MSKTHFIGHHYRTEKKADTEIIISLIKASCTLLVGSDHKYFAALKYPVADLQACSICCQGEKLCDMLMSNDCANTPFRVATPSPTIRFSRCHMLISYQNTFKTCPLCSIITYKLRLKQHNKHCDHTVN